jgi:hypothetical protein
MDFVKFMALWGTAMLTIWLSAVAIYWLVWWMA